MPSANAYVAIDQETIAFTNTQAREADFQTGCKAVALRTTQDVHIAFDRPANSGDFLLKSTDGVVEFHEPFQFTRVSAIGDSTTGNLQILARR